MKFFIPTTTLALAALSLTAPIRVLAAPLPTDAWDCSGSAPAPPQGQNLIQERTPHAASSPTDALTNALGSTPAGGAAGTAGGLLASTPVGSLLASGGGGLLGQLAGILGGLPGIGSLLGPAFALLGLSQDNVVTPASSAAGGAGSALFSQVLNDDQLGVLQEAVAQASAALAAANISTLPNLPVPTGAAASLAASIIANAPTGVPLSVAGVATAAAGGVAGAATGVAGGAAGVPLSVAGKAAGVAGGAAGMAPTGVPLSVAGKATGVVGGAAAKATGMAPSPP